MFRASGDELFHCLRHNFFLDGIIPGGNKFSWNLQGMKEQFVSGLASSFIWSFSLMLGCSNSLLSLSNESYCWTLTLPFVFLLPSSLNPTCCLVLHSLALHNELSTWLVLSDLSCCRILFLSWKTGLNVVSRVVRTSSHTFLLISLDSVPLIGSCSILSLWCNTITK